jgi:hypothetical protein
MRSEAEMRIATHYENIVYDDIAQDGSHFWASRHIDADGGDLFEITERGVYSGKTQDTIYEKKTSRSIGYREARRLIINGRAPGILTRLDKWDADRRAGRIEANEIGGGDAAS